METIELLETVISEMQSEEGRLVALSAHRTSGETTFFGGRLHQLRKHLSYLQQHLNRELDCARYTTTEHQTPTCVMCGCTEQHACEHGCSWVQMDPPVCSRCAARLADSPAVPVCR